MKKYIILVIVVLTIVTYYYLKYNPIEGLTNNTGSTGPTDESRCPNLLIQKGARYYLYNSKIARVPGVNPIVFNNLEDYVEFLDWQHSVGIRCPVLYLQNTYDAQGNRVYKVRPSVTDLQGGLPPASQNHSSTKNSSLNQTQFSNSNTSNTSNQPSSQQKPSTSANYNSKNNLLYSADAMSENWGGETYSTNAVNSGEFKEDEVYKIGSEVQLINKTGPFSPDAMYANWGGEDYSNNAVNSGAYKGDEVTDTTKHIQLINKTGPFSTDAMSENWGGSAYTQNAINSGKFNENNVAIQIN